MPIPLDSLRKDYPGVREATGVVSLSASSRVDKIKNNFSPGIRVSGVWLNPS